MSAPPNTPTSLDAAGLPKPPSGARALNALSLVSVAVALGLVAAAAVPAVVRSSSPVSLSAADSLPHTPNFRPEGMPPVAEHPSFLGDDADEDDRRSELEKLYPNLPWPGQADRDREREERRGLREKALGRVDRGNAQVKFGTARHNFFLLAEPGDVRHSLGLVRADERVMIVKEQDDWALVIKGGPESGTEMGMGWAKKSEIAIR